MKKTLLIAAAALFAASQAYAVDMYIVGGSINGAENWGPGEKMTETTSGVYEWTGTSLGSGFKFNNGGWTDKDYNIGGTEGATNVTLGTAISYITGDASKDFTFANFIVKTPKVVLDMNAQTVLVTGTQEAVQAPDPSDVTFYVIGSHVNNHYKGEGGDGTDWVLADEGGKFTNIGNGIYQWSGSELGTSFKINDGTWSNGDYNIGAASGAMVMNEPFYYWANGSSGNITFDGFTLVMNPVLELNLNDACVTLIGGEPVVEETHWYVTGINGEYELTNDWVLTQKEGTGIFERDVYVVETVGKVKISDNNWAHQFGTNDAEATFIDPSNLSVYLDPVAGEGGDVPYELEEGTYGVQFDADELMLTFIAGGTGVQTVVMGEGNAVYYNLHGQKVANPDKGIYVRVQNGKAVKVIK